MLSSPNIVTANLSNVEGTLVPHFDGGMLFHGVQEVNMSVAQLCPTLCGPVDCSPPGSSVQGILQARILEWVAIPSSGDHPNPGIKPRPHALLVDSSPSEPPGCRFSS